MITLSLRADKKVNRNTYYLTVCSSDTEMINHLQCDVNIIYTNCTKLTRLFKLCYQYVQFGSTQRHMTDNTNILKRDGRSTKE